MTFPFMSTHKIVEGLDYQSPEDFGKYFPVAFDAVRGQILKLEIKQEYREPGKPYDKAISEGNVRDAVKYIPGIIEDNKPTYDMLKAKHVEFIRCRPIKIPVTDYTKWEILVFRETSKHFEDIYWCHYNQIDVIFEKYACHDFLIFDARMALIQDYDDNGLFKGGWFVDDPDKLINLISLFGYIKANCMALDLLQSHKLEI